MMLLFAFVSPALSTATVICAIICIINFDRGFKKISKSKGDAARESYYLRPAGIAHDQTRYTSQPP
jgi:hypothetical protein